MDSTIASGVAASMRAFNTFHASLESSRELDSALSLQLELTDYIGRFKIWAANVGAHQFARRSSLDYRLRDATPIKERVIQLLHNLSELSLTGKKLYYSDIQNSSRLHYS